MENAQVFHVFIFSEGKTNGKLIFVNMKVYYVEMKYQKFQNHIKKRNKRKRSNEKPKFKLKYIKPMKTNKYCKCKVKQIIKNMFSCFS